MWRTIMWRLPGQISTRPARSKSPERASCTSSWQHSSSRFANISVKPSGMCCTTRIVPVNSPGICDRTNCSAFGPPVEIPMAMTRFGGIGLRPGFLDVCASSWIGGTSKRLPPARLATLTFSISCPAIASRLPAAASLGFATKSIAPRARALKVE